MFDAGAISARLTVDTSQFDRDMADAEARVRRFTDDDHKVKISAVFDDTSMSRATKAFSDLDNQISRDAMNRLRSSPQGSVLGALNALFSPHPVTGAPSASQSASQGLLGQMISGTNGGTGTPVGSGGGSSPTNTVGQVLTGQNPSGTSTTNTVQQVQTGQNPGNTSTIDQIRQILTGQGPVDQSTIDDIKQVLTGQGPQNASTIDQIKQVLTGKGPVDQTTIDKIQQVLTGQGPQNTTTVNTVKQVLDPEALKQLDANSKNSGNKSGSTWANAFATGITGLLGNLAGRLFTGGGGGGGPIDNAAKGAGDAAGKGWGQSFGSAATNTLGGIGPTILGLGLKPTLITGAIGTALAALPALGGVIGTGAGVAIGAGLVAAVASTSPAIKSQFTSIGSEAEQTLEKAGAAIVPALHSVLDQVPALLKSIQAPLSQIFATIGPQLQSVFNGLKPILTGVLGLAQAAAPAFGPFITGLESLVSNLFPGLITITKATVPVISQFGGILATLGSNLGGLFSSMAPAVKASMTVLSALLGLVGGLLPVIGKLAAVFATALAPVIVSFAGAIKALTPTLTTVGTVLASLAGAIIGDLSGAFASLGQLLTAISPALNTFATAIGQAFTVLENTGVFAILGDAIENLVPPLGKLIDAILQGLVPILPPVISFVSTLSALLASQLANAVQTLIPPLIQLVTGVFQVLDALLPVLLPLLTDFAEIFTDALVSAVSALATALADMINATPPSVLGGIVVGVLAIVGAFKAFAIIQGLIGGIQTAMGLFSLNMLKFQAQIAVAAAQAAAEWVASAAATVGSFVAMAAAATAAYVAENLATLGIIAGITLLVAAIVYAATHWSQVWGAIQTAAGDAWHWLDSNVVQPMANWFTVSLPHAFDLAIGFLKTVFVTPWEQQFNAVWSFLQTIGTDIANFFTKTLPGWWDSAITFLGTHFVTPLENGMRAAWNWVVANVGAPIDTFFTKTIVGYWDSAITFLGSHFVTPFQNGLKAAYTWVVANVAIPIETLFTKTLPGWFSTAVSAVSGVWGKIESVVEAPVKFVIDDVIDKLIAVFDDITNAVGLNKPIPMVTLASGGRLPGYGGGDILPALLEPGETVVDKDTSRRYAQIFKMMGVPGFASGGVAGGPTNMTGRGGALGGVNPTGSAAGPLGGIVSGGIDLGKAVLAIATGNPTALANAITSMFGGSSSGGLGGTVGKALLGMPAALIGDFAHWIVGTNNTASAQGTGGAATLKPTGTGATIQALMQSMAASVGWTGAEWTALNNVEMREAGYNLTATNPTSGAYGLAQFINGPGEYAQYGGNSTTAAGQITAFLNYVKDRYGDPEAAWAHEEAYGWYDNGGTITEPILGYGVSSGRRYGFGGAGREQVTPAHEVARNATAQSAMNDSLARIETKFDTLIEATRQAPARTGERVGSAIGGAASNAAWNNRYPRGGW